MIGLDTNILVRFVTHDDEAQWKQADAYLKKHCTVKRPGWISSIVLYELVWVLCRGYEYDKADILALLEQLSLTSEIKIEGHDCVRKAIHDFAKGKADFSDYLIGYLNKARGCETTITLNKSAATHANFTLLGKL